MPQKSAGRRSSIRCSRKHSRAETSWRQSGIWGLGPVWVIGTFSKVLFPSLRLGDVIAPVP
ncbi:hypothetical protein E4K65_34215 [Bradyrhizobium niftali]|uniref:Uncharacterized protein n=1 Tax=Bradyrhizobium niftali TaxID=2560055 RepID=A0A4Y9LH81_9BRAD|nr:hypothetical protein E4K65_34215 [Bradyrhizobium niftali]